MGISIRIKDDRYNGSFPSVEITTYSGSVSYEQIVVALEKVKQHYIDRIDLELEFD